MAAPSTTVASAGPARPARTYWERLRGGDEIAYLITFIAAAMVLLVTALLVYELYINSAVSRSKFGWNFLFTSTWDPVNDQFGALPFIYGTLVSSALALFIGIPLGVGAAIFLAELAPPKISDALTFLIELLAAVPSVIYGLLGNFRAGADLASSGAGLRGRARMDPAVQRPLLRSQPVFGGRGAFGDDHPVHHFDFPRSDFGGPGRSARSRPGAGRHPLGNHLGCRGALRQKGIMGSIFLALARSLGETMAVTMVIGNDPKIKASLFAPGYSIAAVIANEFTEATGQMYTSALIELGPGSVRPDHRDQRRGAPAGHGSRQVQGIICPTCTHSAGRPSTL